MSRLRSAARFALTIALGGVLGGCLGSEATAPPGTATPEPVATPVVTHYGLNTTVWIQGLVLTFHDATATLDSKGGPVTVTFNIRNPGHESATLDVPMRLTASGSAFDPVHGTVLPEIAPGNLVDVSVEFDVEGRSSIDDGVLRVGRTADHAVQLPFREGPVATITLAPQAADLKAAVTAGGIRVTLRRREVRWDLPDWYDELPLGSEALILTYDVTYIGTFAGGFAFTGANVSLRLPDGTVVTPRRDGHSQSVQLINRGKTLTNLFTRFEIPNGVTGNFAFIARDGTAQKAVTFTIAP